jgi:hypothetical protein
MARPPDLYIVSRCKEFYWGKEEPKKIISAFSPKLQA